MPEISKMHYIENGSASAVLFIPIPHLWTDFVFIPETALTRIKRIITMFLKLCLISAILQLAYPAVLESDLFPYDESLDARFMFGDDAFIRYDFKILFTFFNVTYNSTFISGNGQISFQRGVTTYIPLCAPSSVPMIMAYWADSDNNVDRVNAKLLFRETTNRTLLRKASKDVLSAFPHLKGIQLSWMFIVTWKEIPFYGASRECDGTLKRNTFQMALASDGISFVILNYNKIEWTTGTSSYSSNCHGLGGSPAKVGFDYGDGTTLYTVPQSCTDYILNVTETSNINQPGKWVFRIDSNLETASCESFDGSKQKLKVKPSVASLMGNVPVRLEGPCVCENTPVFCIFHDHNATEPVTTEVEGVIAQDSKAVICQMPYFHNHGRVKVELKIKHNSTGGQEGGTLYKGFIYVVDDEQIGDILRYQLTLDEDHKTFVIEASWDPEYFQSEPENLDRRKRSSVSNHPPEVVDLFLESFDGHEWRNLGVLKRGIPNTGSFTGSVNQTLVKDALKADQFQFLMMSMRSSNKPNGRRAKRSLFKFFRKLYSSVKSGIVTTGQFVKAFYPNPTDGLCKYWHTNADPPPNDTLPCPPTLELAEIDGDFENDAAGILLPFFHPGAHVSKRQKLPSKSGAGSQCVYDKSGDLMTGPPGGGTLDRYSPNYDFWRHQLHDVLPYLACCRLSTRNESCRDRYYDKRPSGKVKQYPTEVRRIARAVGDPHITTFDGYTYTFNGVGEFWMVKLYHEEEENNSLTFKMQARMEQYISSEGRPSNASVFTAIAMEEARAEEAVRVQVSHTDGKILIALDGEPIDIDDDSADLKDFSLRHKNAHISVKPDDTVTVTFSSGLSFNFTTAGTNEVALNFVGNASPSQRNLTEGLMGNFDGDRDNELRAPDGRTTLPPNSTQQQIHYEFGMLWMVAEAESIFMYPKGKSYSHYSQPNFRPTFIMPWDVSSLPPKVLESCGSYSECIFDYLTTGSEAIASGTKRSTVTFEHSVQVQTTRVKMCDSFSIENGYASISTMMLGGVVEFGCHEGYRLESNPQNCTCVIDDQDNAAQWVCNDMLILPPTCTPDTSIVSASCVNPQSPKNGYVIVGKDFAVGSTIEFKCDRGYELFWKKCKFNGPAGICKEYCNVTYTCALEETTMDNGTVTSWAPVWQGYGGDISQVSCLSTAAAKVSTFLRGTELFIHIATQGKLVGEVTKPHLVGC